MRILPRTHRMPLIRGCRLPTLLVAHIQPMLPLPAMQLDAVGSLAALTSLRIKRMDLGPGMSQLARLRGLKSFTYEFSALPGLLPCLQASVNPLLAAQA